MGGDGDGGVRYQFSGRGSNQEETVLGPILFVPVTPPSMLLGGGKLSITFNFFKVGVFLKPQIHPSPPKNTPNCYISNVAP